MADASILGSRINERRTVLGWSLDQLAQAAGTSEQHVDRIERGITKHSRFIPLILEALTRAEGDRTASPPPGAVLLAEPDEAPASAPAPMSAPVPLTPQVEQPRPSFTAPQPPSTGDSFAAEPSPAVFGPSDAVLELDLNIPLSNATAALVPGAGIDESGALPEGARDWWRLPDWILNALNLHPGQLRCVPVRGDSMAPVLDEGDIALVDLANNVPSPPGLYALADEFGGIVIRRLEVVSRRGEPQIRVRISAENEQYLPQERLLDEIGILGRHVGMFSFRTRR
ncbi:Phage repressor protein C, contains Cro/C1-type HTH and peptisase s24 domains [Faunimonas pinastri]|uniref:Phage repressor protein C, contains Cro/C1-type HTH and peptisase s24 domains n=1 Tax=Faunimonas pinastri TaxID=1855383 RepID=A0A1H9JFQ4_9HYPH|nr:S24 family peptidase [Faunimonas pinastri]SEQ85385.1 Phage repressor protein C, contains Cro/C1-type HTH and peptisase s24 domains [Faunimonas pinastri]